MANAKEYLFWVITSGKGMLPAGQKVGKVGVKSKSTDLDVLKEKAYEQLAQSSLYPRNKDLELIPGED